MISASSARAKRATAVALAGLGAVVGLAACTSAGRADGTPPTTTSPPLLAPVGPGPSERPGTGVAAQAVRPPVTASPAATNGRSSAAGPITSAAPQTRSTPAAVVTRPAAPRSTCAAITTRVIRGSAEFGREFAALQFTNAGTATCRLTGYPRVALMRGRQPIGSPARPATDAASTYLLTPGATAESRLDDYTTCQAPLSDQIRVVVPGSSTASVRPAQLRACTLRVSALAAPE